MAVLFGLVFEVVCAGTGVVVSYNTHLVHNYGQPYVEVHHTIPKIDIKRKILHKTKMVNLEYGEEWKKEKRKKVKVKGKRSRLKLRSGSI